MENQLDIVASLRQDLLEDNSANNKKAKLSEFVSMYKDNKAVMTVLDMIFNSEKFSLTSKIFEHPASFRTDNKESSVSDIEVSAALATLQIQSISASQKKDLLKTYHESLSKGAAEVLECILDKDLKCGVSSATYKACVKTNKTLGVSLANSYFNKKKKVNFEKDDWYMSRKLDGCRLNIIKQGDKVLTLSRTGKEFTTLEVLKHIFQQIPGDFVLDGEVITKSGLDHDDFKSIVSQVKRKDYTIPDPVMMVFDMYSLEVAYGEETSAIFSERYKTLQEFFNRNKEVLGDNVIIVDQKKVVDEDMLMEEFNKAEDAGWEGLMIRKDVSWEGKRTDNLLKIKSFEDGEFTITGYTLGDFRYKNTVLHNVLASVEVYYKGYTCSVGSGWSLDERKNYASEPEQLIGRVLKVKYFEETTNDKGEKSMRFPIKVFLYDKTGRFD